MMSRGSSPATRDGAVGWAYEVDGLDGAVLIDDANVPSLLALPYLGVCAPGDPLCLVTRRRILRRQPLVVQRSGR